MKLNSMNAMLRVVLLCSLVVCACLPAVPAFQVNKRTKVVMNVVSVSNCSENQKLPNYIRNIKVIVLDRDVILVNGEFVVVGNLINHQAEWLFYRCTNRDATECEQFLRIPFPDVCFFLKAKDQFWSPIVNAIHPPMDCPHIKPGVYKMINGTYDAAKTMEIASNIPNVMDYYWRQRVTIFSEKFSKKTIAFCSTHVGKIDLIRKPR